MNLINSYDSNSLNSTSKKNLRSVLLEHAKSQGQTKAILAPDRTGLTFAGLADRIAEIKSQLNALGIGRGDRIAAALPNGPDSAVCYLGVAACATYVPLNPAYTLDEFSRYLDALKPRAIVVPSDAGPIIRQAAAAASLPVIELTIDRNAPAGCFTLTGRQPGVCRDPDWSQPDDITLIVPTSGTTGKQKLVPHKIHNLINYGVEMGEWYGLGPEDRGLHFMPIFHGHGLNSSLLTPIVTGGSVVCLPNFEVSAFYEALDAYSPTWYSAGYTFHRAILEGASNYREIAARSRLRFIRSGSGRLDPLVMQGLEEVFSVPVVERYGMTECHTIAANPLPPGHRKPGAAGIPFFKEVAILSDDGSILEQGETGEIVVQGDSIFSGYLNDPEATESAFVNGWFRTGDVGYFDADGYLTITGRVNNLINRGGEKIGPLEVEDVIGRHAAVKEACVFGIQHPSMGEEVAAAVVLLPGLTATEHELQDMVRAELADFKVPKRISFFDQFPLGATGKTDRSQVAQDCAFSAEETAKPHDKRTKTPLEKAISGIFASVLQLDHEIDPDGNFFMLGGDSLRAAELVRTVNEIFDVELELRQFISEMLTVAAIAEFIVAARKRQAGEKGAETGNSIKGPIPKQKSGSRKFLAPAERRLWLLEQLEPEKTAYNILRCFRLIGNIDRVALSRALDAILARHEVLRSAFEIKGGKPFRTIRAQKSWPLAYRDIPETPGMSTEDAAMLRIQDEARTPFDLLTGPLVRATLYRLDAEHHLLAIGMHHIVTDLASLTIFVREIETIYNAILVGETPDLPVLPIQYPDYAHWAIERIKSRQHKEQVAYWCSQMAAAPPMLSLPFDNPPAGKSSDVGGRILHHCPRQLYDRIIAIGQSHNATPFMTMLAAFNLFMFQQTNQDDIVIGSPISGRNHRDMENLLGFFLNTLLLRTNLSGNPTFSELLARVRDTASMAYANQDVMLDELVEILQPAREPGRIPFHNVAFIFGPENSKPDLTGLDVQNVRLHIGTVKYDLQVHVFETKNRFSYAFDYNTDLFEAETVTRMALRFEELLTAIADDPERRLGDLPLLAGDERKMVLRDWNETSRSISGPPCAHMLFEAQAGHSPLAEAIVSGNDRLTYGELDCAANQLAHYLRSVEVGPEVAVGICLPRSIEWVTAMLAIHKAGGAFVAMNPEDPAERLRTIIGKSGARLVICRENDESRLDGSGARLINVDRDRGKIERMPDTRPNIELSGENLAYILFTSGSTGAPKGVQVEHHSLLNLCHWHNGAFGVAHNDRASVIASPSFDVALWEVFPYLGTGASLFIVDDDTRLSAQSIIDFWRDNSIDIAWLPTAMAEMVVKTYEPGAAKLRYLLTGGEQLRSRPPRNLGFEFINAYGLTEFTVIATCSTAIEPEIERAIPIGRPIDNTKAYVLDDRLRAVPVGVAGELYLAGDGLARGYVNEPVLTADSFVADPFSDTPGARMYKTGDFVRYESDGALVFLGRRDGQIKLRGFRIELGEVEHVLQLHSAIVQSAVIPVPNAREPERLHAFIVPLEGGGLDLEALRSFIRHKLPEHMVPGGFSTLDSLPLNSNGKIDRGALPTEPIGDRGGMTGIMRPRNPVEIQIIRIWHDLLGTTDIGVTQNFFDVGGHSLMAAQMMTEIETIFGKKLPLQILWYGEGTVEDLALRLTETDSSDLWSRPVPIKAGGDRRPLFCIHVPGGILSDYAELCELLPDDQPVFGLQAVGLDGSVAAHSDVKDIARHCVSSLQKIQEHGPYRIIGYCAAGLFAFETVRQLIAGGEEIEYFALLDTAAPVARLRDRVRREIARLASADGLARIAAKGYRFIRSQLANRPPTGAASIGAAHQHAVESFRPSPIPGEAVMYYCEDGNRKRGVAFGWDRLLSRGLILKGTPGDHETMMRTPNVSTLAKSISMDLDRLNGIGK